MASSDPPERRPKRQCVARRVTKLPSAAHYVGYVEDEETPEMIMRKFDELERVRARAAARKPAATATGAAPPPTDSDKENGRSQRQGDRATLVPGSKTDAAATDAPEGPAQPHSSSPSDRDDDQPLDESTLVQVFRQTSIFNVRTALAHNSVLRHASTSGSGGGDHHSGAAARRDDVQGPGHGGDPCGGVDACDSPPPRADVGSEEEQDLEVMRSFWSDDEFFDGKGGGKGGGAKGAHRKGGAGKGGGAARQRRAGSAPRDRDPSSVWRTLGITARERSMRNQVVVQYNKDSQALIRRRMRQQGSREDITQVKVPRPPLPTAWGRTVQPYHPSAAAHFLAALSQYRASRGWHAPQGRMEAQPQTAAAQAGLAVAARPEAPGSPLPAAKGVLCDRGPCPGASHSPPCESVRAGTTAAPQLAPPGLPVGLHQAPDPQLAGLLHALRLTVEAADAAGVEKGGASQRGAWGASQALTSSLASAAQQVQQLLVERRGFAGLPGPSQESSRAAAGAAPHPSLEPLPALVTAQSDSVELLDAQLRARTANGSLQAECADDEGADATQEPELAKAAPGESILVPDVVKCGLKAAVGGRRFNMVLINSGWEVAGAWEEGGCSVHLPSDAELVARLAQLPVPALCPTGFVLIWAAKMHLQAVCKQLYAWGYTYVENLSWVWLHVDHSILALPSPYCRRSHVTLLIFRKEGEGRDIALRHQRNPDVVLDCLRTHEPTRSPPAEVYAILETMLPGEVAGGRCLELWAPPSHGVPRPGWVHVSEQSADGQTCVGTNTQCCPG